MSPRMNVFDPVYVCKSTIFLFYVSFWSYGFLFAERLFSPCQYRTRLFCNTTSAPASKGLCLLFCGQFSHFRPKTVSFLSDMMIGSSHLETDPQDEADCSMILFQISWSNKGAVCTGVALKYIHWWASN